MAPMSMKDAQPKGVDEQELSLRLSRAGDLLRSERLDEAEKEIRLALELSPGDLRARNLQGLLHFRAGRYAEALEIYRELLVERESDVALRLNLGLVELRMGHYPQAVEHLRWVTQAEPGNTRAQGYYGLALMRAGELHKAREVLERAGQTELVRQVDRLAAEGGADRGGEREAAPTSTARAAAAADAQGRYTMAEARRAVAAGERALEAEQPFVPAEAGAPAHAPGPAHNAEGEWQARSASQGLPAPPASGSPLRPMPIPVPEERTLPPPPLPGFIHQAQPLASFVRSRELAPPADGACFTVTGDGLLLVRVAGQLPTRSVGVVVSTGELSFEPLFRRARGRTLKEPFGDGPFGLFLASGTGMMIISPRGGDFTALSLTDESIFVRESATFAFEGGLHFENGRLPGAGPAPVYHYPGLPDALGRVVQFRGSGHLVLRTDRPLFTVRLTGNQTAFIEVEHLVGWLGRVIPSLLTEESGQPTPYVECSGEGFLLVEPPPKDGAPEPLVPTEPGAGQAGAGEAAQEPRG